MNVIVAEILFTIFGVVEGATIKIIIKLQVIIFNTLSPTAISKASADVFSTLRPPSGPSVSADASNIR